ncbi:MAG: hypothetical protein O2955_18540 [Planctomycetota bacterium]|nr:hypothetical protein [Planctomycetota bacterium]MDA1214512.1 hypothetical protein [Planctomycetota bacterium]
MRPIASLLVTALIFGLAVVAVDAAERLPGERYLNDFTNDDGCHPDGCDTDCDDSSALRHALAQGPGVVRIGAGYFRFGDISIPEGVTIVGQGKATVIRRNQTADRIFNVANTSEWVLRDVVLDGEATGEWQKREDAGQSGLSTTGCWGFEVVGVTARNFSGAGFRFSYTDLAQATFSDGGRIDRLVAVGNHTGILFDTRGEYITATHLNATKNAVGCTIHAGNTNISVSNFCGNIDGLMIVDKENGSHGSISNCLLNHNARYALWARAVDNGMAINNCCFFYGTIRLEETTGVQIASSLISCHVKTMGEYANRFTDNHIIPQGGWTFEFGEKTIVEGNFTKTGPWEQNRQTDQTD